MKQYLDIVRHVLTTGVRMPNRTGIDTLVTFGTQFEHDMSTGFPLITTKKVSLKNVATELQFFISGNTDKRWLQQRGCHIWDEWHAPGKPEWELGRVYGAQWLNFGGVDQLSQLVDKLVKHQFDRRMIVSAWNPPEIDSLALPPCHYAFQVGVVGDTLNLVWIQRSVDVALGLPYDIASYGLMLLLLSRAARLKPGRLVGQFADTHVYVNHVDGLRDQLNRAPFALPTVKLTNEVLDDRDSGVFTWNYDELELTGYDPHPAIKFQVAV